MAGTGGRREGAGRKPGVPNKFNADLKAMILGALEDAGGRRYLAKQAVENPGPFMALLGKILPTQLATADGASIRMHLLAAVATGKMLQAESETRLPVINGTSEPAAGVDLLAAPLPTE